MPLSRRVTIRARILLVFTALLMLSFSAIGFIFNIAATSYIETSAAEQLVSTSFALHLLDSYNDMYAAEESELPGADRRPINVFRIQADVFAMNTQYATQQDQPLPSEAAEIAQALRTGGADLTLLDGNWIRTPSSVYYLTAEHAPHGPWGEDSYWIIYADVSGLTNFASTVNLFLVLLVGLAFLGGMVAAFFLAGSITRPIQKLNQLALNIGRGDFTPNNFRFSDLEFINLNHTLNKTARQLAQYDQEQKTFFQNVSHELRTPLMSIQCYAEGIAEGVMAPQQASATILQETGRLTELVKDLLYISKLDNISAPFAPEPADLAALARDCCARQRAIAEARGVELEAKTPDSPVTVECVPDLLARAADNLLANAIRFAKRSVTVSVYTEANAQAVLRVSDDGPGIDAETLPHIFERFYKGKGGNHGIGLSIAKSVAEQHRGSVTAENIPAAPDGTAAGAVFTIKIPAGERRRLTRASV